MKTPTRAQITRPISVALTLTVSGETFYFVVWGLVLFPQGEIWVKAVWTATCGIAMGLAIGALVTWLVVGRLGAPADAIASGAIYFVVLAYCSFLCAGIGASTRYFGAHTHPTLFIGAGLIPAFVSAFLYGWILFDPRGSRFLDKLGY